MMFERTRGTFVVTTDPARLDLAAVHAFLASSYWSPGIPLAVVERATANSLCFSLLAAEGRQVGLARIITDGATFAYLCDVYVLPELRGQGLGLWLMQCVMDHPQLAALRRVSLVTRDAHALYRKVGFTSLANPAGHMEIVRPDIYRQSPPPPEEPQ